VEDFQNEGVSVWSGVKSPQALKYIRSMQPGDRVFIYHSTGQSAIVGLAEVISEPEPDPKIKKSWMVEMEFLQMISPPVTLKEIKQSGLFEDFRLVYQSRLSTMDVPENFVEWLRKVKRLKI
jgi:predicted RNA-binding protein with PUA-like domain